MSRAALGAAAALVAAGSLAACGDDSSQSSASSKAGAPSEVKFALTDKGCSPSARNAAAGPVRIAVNNPGTTKTDELELKGKGGNILGERENIAPGQSADFTLTLKPGTYVVNCAFQNNGRDNGRLVVSGSAPTAGSPRLAEAVRVYRADVERHADGLAKKTAVFTAALKTGDVQKAKDLFGPTRYDYEAIEPIAESFGNLDPEIDARVNDVANESNWTGFHRIEQILFVRNTTRGTARYATKLNADVRKLDDSIDGLHLQPAQIANGAVGLLDEVSSSKITGEEDRYSHTDLSDFQGNLTGAKEAFEALRPALVRDGQTALVKRIEARMAIVQRGLDRYRRNTPLGFAEYSELTKRDRRQFAQRLAALAEPLSQVAGKVS
jgi:iron uptake system component EfeO